MAADSVAQNDLDLSSTPVDTSARGRRRRAASPPEPVPDTEAVVPQADNASPRSRRGRQRAKAAPTSDADTAADVPAQQVNGTEAASEKRRGRKKAQPVDVAAETVADTPVEVAPEAVADEFARQVNDAEAVSGKRRGRKKAPPVEVAADTDTPVQLTPSSVADAPPEAVLEQPKRRRGRPPRAATVSAGAAPDTAVQPAAMGDSADGVRAPVSVAPRRGRRPRSERTAPPAPAVATPVAASTAPTAAALQRDYDSEMARLQQIWPRLVGQARRAVVLYAANLAIEGD